MTPAYLNELFVYRYLPATAPCSASEEMVRKNQPFVTVRSESLTDVAEGETMTTPLVAAISIEERVPPENWAPTIAFTWFWVISFVVAASAAVDCGWSSSLKI